MYDLLIKGAMIYDGSGTDGFVSDLLIDNGKIIKLRKNISDLAREVIDARGLVLTPGFIDFHTHSEIYGLKDPYMKARIGQGITTDLCGNCGIGIFPLNQNKEYLLPLNNDVLGHFDNYSWSDFSSYSNKISGKMGINQAYLCSHAPLRIAALGSDSGRAANDKEIDFMCSLLDDALSQGCMGLSSGLYYAPCSSADRNELVRLLKTVKKHDKLFCVHHRIEGPEIVSSIKEVLDLALETGVRLEISHLKIIGRKYGYLLDDIFNLFDTYISKGVDVKFDQYPYHYGSTSLFSLLPAHVLALTRNEQMRVLKDEDERKIIKEEMLNPAGWESLFPVVGPDDISILSLDQGHKYDGLSLTEISKITNTEPLDTLLDILSDEAGAAVMIDITESEETLKRILAHPLMCFGTDSLYSTPIPHPRSYSATIHLLQDYVLRDKIISFPEAIRKMTYEGATRLRLKDIGLIKEGYRADINILSLENLKATATLDKPFVKNDGLEFVIIGGKIAYERGKFNNTLSGLLLKSEEL